MSDLIALNKGVTVTNKSYFNKKLYSSYVNGFHTEVCNGYGIKVETVTRKIDTQSQDFKVHIDTHGNYKLRFLPE